MTPCAVCGLNFIKRAPHQRYCGKVCKQVQDQEAAKLRYATQPIVREKAAANARRWAAANRARRHATRAKWIAANPDARREVARRWRLNNPDKQRDLQNAWRAANPDRWRRYGRERRARLRGVDSDDYTNSEIYQRDKGICQLCLRPVNLRWSWPNKRSACIDHVIPVKDGGSNTRANVQLAHLGCNNAKQDRILPRGEQLRIVG